VTIRIPHHPGEGIRLDCIEPLGMTVTEAARKLDVSRKHLSSVLNGRAGVSPKMAMRLSKAFGGTPELWRRLQALHDVALAEQNAGEIDVERICLPRERERAPERRHADAEGQIPISA